jgi:hypothetical protein
MSALDGLPALAEPIAAFAGALMTEDAVSYSSLGYAPQWGIFLDGAPVVTADCVVEVSYKQEWVLSDYPVEEGAFSSYDKVYTPYDVRVKYAAGGSEANRAALLASIKSIASDYNFYDVAMPEATFVSCNIIHWDFRRTSKNGLGLVQVDVWLEQVLVAGSTPPFSSDSVGSPDAANAVNDGSVQAVDSTNMAQQPYTITDSASTFAAAGPPS